MKFSLNVSLLFLFCALSGVMAAGGSALAVQQIIYPGFKTLGIWRADNHLRLDVNVWYPSIRIPFAVSYGPWGMFVARNGKEVAGRFPLIILSHDTQGDRFSYHDTAARLTRRGFVVAAPTHAGDNINDMSTLFTLQQLLGRAWQISGLISSLLENHDIGPMIDESRIGVVGFGVGGAAALLTGGALLDSVGWEGYCAQTARNDPYCSPWAIGKLNKMVEGLPMRASMADRRIKSVAAVAPAFGMLFSSAGMRFFYPPLLLVRADRDMVNRTPQHADAILHYMSKPVHFATLPGAGGNDLMAECPPSLKAELPELCAGVDPETRQEIHIKLDNLLANFFLETLGDPEKVANIPAPPVLSVPEPAKPPRAANRAAVASPKPNPPEKKKTKKAPVKDRVPDSVAGPAD